MKRSGLAALATMLLLACACDRQAVPSETPAPAPAEAQSVEAPAQDAGPAAPVDPPRYTDYLVPVELMPRFNDLVSECPDERVCMFEHDGSVLVGKRAWEEVRMVDFMTTHLPAYIDEPDDALLHARLEYTVRGLLEDRDEVEVMIHCELAEELPALLPDPPADEAACHEGARRTEHWTLVRIEPDPERLAELAAVIQPAEHERRAAWDELQAYEAKAESLGGSVSVKFRLPEVTGALDRSEVTRVLMRNRRFLRFCYIDGLLVDPGLAGAIEFHLEIDEGGTLTSVDIASNTMASPDVARCIGDAIASWSFAAAPGAGSSRAIWRPEFEPPKSR